MRVIAVSTLRTFWEQHPDAEQPLKAWYDEACKASWGQPSDIKAMYGSASVLKNRRVVFNIKGNDYRLIVAIAYRLQVVYVKYVGTPPGVRLRRCRNRRNALTHPEIGMLIRPIHNPADHQSALRKISGLMESDPEPGSPDGDHLDILVTLVQAYEARQTPIGPPDPVEAIKFRMEQSGLTVKDLEPMIGRSNRVYEVLSRKRPLTLAMIRKLNRSLGIPADILIAETLQP